MSRRRSDPRVGGEEQQTVGDELEDSRADQTRQRHQPEDPQQRRQESERGAHPEAQPRLCGEVIEIVTGVFRRLGESLLREERVGQRRTEIERRPDQPRKDHGARDRQRSNWQRATAQPLACDDDRHQQHSIVTTEKCEAEAESGQRFAFLLQAKERRERERDDPVRFEREPRVRAGPSEPDQRGRERREAARRVAQQQIDQHGLGRERSRAEQHGHLGNPALEHRVEAGEQQCAERRGRAEDRLSRVEREAVAARQIAGELERDVRVVVTQRAEQQEHDPRGRSEAERREESAPHSRSIPHRRAAVSVICCS